MPVAIRNQQAFRRCSPSRGKMVEEREYLLHVCLSCLPLLHNALLNCGECWTPKRRESLELRVKA